MQKRTRVNAANGKDVKGGTSAAPARDVRGAEKATTKTVVIPESLNAATKAVAAIRQQSMMELVAALLRGDSEISAMERRLVGAGGGNA